MASRASTEELLVQYTSAGRRGVPGPLSQHDAAFLQQAGWPSDIPLSQWTGADVARLSLLLDRSRDTAPEDFLRDASACYEQGDASEQRSWCRGVSLLPAPERFLPLMIDACRTNILPLFESIACENPFPARHFPERNFNQLVLKALFNGIALERIVALQSRFNAELARMADDYVTEREKAGRSVPPDIWIVIAPHAEGRSLERLRRYSTAHEDTR
jgi:hypothetical protein